MHFLCRAKFVGFLTSQADEVATSVSDWIRSGFVWRSEVGLGGLVVGLSVLGAPYELLQATAGSVRRGLDRLYRLRSFISTRQSKYIFTYKTSKMWNKQNPCLNT